jgi:hypothetical protein
LRIYSDIRRGLSCRESLNSYAAADDDHDVDDEETLWRTR